MKGGSGRSTEQIRGEIRTERERLDVALGSLAAEAKRSGRLAGTALTALGGALLLRRLRRRRR